MKISLVTRTLDNLTTDLLALGGFQGEVTQVPLFQALDKRLDGRLGQTLEEEQFFGEKDEALLIHTLGSIPASRVLLLGLGKRGDFGVPDLRRYAAFVAGQARISRCDQVTVSLPPLDASSYAKEIQFITEGFSLGLYRFDQYKTKDSKKEHKIKVLEILLENEKAEPLGLAIERGKVTAGAICWARDLVNEPAVALNPAVLAEKAKALAQKSDLECKVLGPKECRQQKMNLFLAVAQGSDNEPRFIHLRYRPKGRSKPKHRIVLVGKGVTFDSGGLSLKPSASMLDMKSDMAGAAAVLAVMQALEPLGVQAEVHALVAAAENMVSGSAFRIGDIFTGMAGKSVEIVNTDAEGRLTLADALAYGLKQNPDEMVDVATLTGACVVALGPHMAGIMGNDRALVERFMAASRRAGEDIWDLPLPSALLEQLKSPVADLKNSGDRWGSALTAGLFLKEFVGDVPWIHLDIAGPAFADKDNGHIRKGGTGYAVAALLEYLVSRDSSS